VYWVINFLDGNLNNMEKFGCREDHPPCINGNHVIAVRGGI